MQRAIIIISALLIHFALNAQTPDFFMQTEYRNDSVDFSGNTQYYNREKLSIFFSEQSTFNTAYIYLTKYEEKKYTWNLVLKDISPCFTFLFGNYFITFGSGLLIGKKNFFNPDIFEYKIVKHKSGFSPCNNGNPVYSFNGAAIGFNYKFNTCKISLDSFCSIKERFINSDEYSEDAYSASLSTLDTKISDKYNTTDPVNLVSAGSMFSVQIIQRMLFQIYSIITNIQSPGTDEKIMWDYYNKAGEDYGVLKFTGYGFYSQYKDNYLDLVFDACVTRKYIITNNHKDIITGSAFLYSVKFTPPFFELAFTGKQTDNRFYSPYTSTIGNDYPENAFFLNCKIKPYSNLHIGSGLSSQKKTQPSNSSQGLNITQNEKLYIEYNYKILKEFKISTSQADYKETGDRKNQYKNNITIEINKTVRIKYRSIFQQANNSKDSWLAGGGSEFSFLKNFSFNFYYFRAKSSSENPLYFVAYPLKNTGIPGLFINQKSDIIISKFIFNLKKISVNIRYMHQYNEIKTLKSRVEIAANAVF